MPVQHKIVNRDPAKLRPHPRNSREHSDQQIAQVANSIETFGFTIPVLVTTGDMIVAGHCRTLAAQKLGIKKVPCLVADGWTEAQIRAYVIADNKLTENGSWNEVMLAEELTFLRDADADLLASVGYDDTELERLRQIDDGYQPTLDPEAAGAVVTAEDVAKAQEQADTQFDAPKQVLVPLTCPHCGEDFQVDAAQIKTGTKA